MNQGRPSAVHALLELGATLVSQADRAGVLNVGLVSGGRSVNAIADTAELIVEARAVDEAPLLALREELERIEVVPPLGVTVDILGRRPSGRLDRASPIFHLIRDVRADLGLPDALDAGSTDANAALAYGIPSLALGVAAGAEMHTPNERIEIDSLSLGFRQFEQIVKRALKEDYSGSTSRDDARAMQPPILRRKSAGDAMESPRHGIERACTPQRIVALSKGWEPRRVRLDRLGVGFRFFTPSAPDARANLARVLASRSQNNRSHRRLGTPFVSIEKRPLCRHEQRPHNRRDLRTN